MNIILVLKKGNTISLIRDWIYPFPPTTYYHHLGLLNVEIYEYDYTSRDGKYSFYKILS